MKTYAIGDIQGCLNSLQALMQRIEQESPAARYLLTGDLVNRGPLSLETLRFIRALGDRVVTVLGNHDLHLLAMAAGVRKNDEKDSLETIFKAPDCKELIKWLRTRPMAYAENGYLLVHAGVLPQWSFEQTLSLAKEVESILHGDNWGDFLHDMYGNEPTKWKDDLIGKARWRCIVNGLTRLRFCSEDGEMNFVIKDGPALKPKGLFPWFDIKTRKTINNKIIFGHWSTLGLLLRSNLIALDTGCVWGGKLTAICLENQELYQVDCQDRIL